MRTRVHIAVLLSQEADERQIGGKGKIHGKARRRRYGCKQRNPSHKRLLHHLKSSAATHQKHVTVERNLALRKRPTDHLIRGIRSADVFAEHDQLTTRIKKRGRVERACRTEDGLPSAKLFRHLAKRFGIESGYGIRPWQAAPPNLGDRGLAADTAS